MPGRDAPFILRGGGNLPSRKRHQNVRCERRVRKIYDDISIVAETRLHHGKYHFTTIQRELALRNQCKKKHKFISGGVSI
jgi:hypothetical protein